MLSIGLGKRKKKKIGHHNTVTCKVVLYLTMPFRGAQASCTTFEFPTSHAVYLWCSGRGAAGAAGRPAGADTDHCRDARRAAPRRRLGPPDCLFCTFCEWTLCDATTRKLPMTQWLWQTPCCRAVPTADASDATRRLCQRRHQTVVGADVSPWWPSRRSLCLRIPLHVLLPLPRCPPRVRFGRWCWRRDHRRCSPGMGEKMVAAAAALALPKHRPPAISFHTVPVAAVHRWMVT